MKFYIVLTVLSFLALDSIFGCAPSQRKVETYCSHPAIAGGMPFPLKDHKISTSGYVIQVELGNPPTKVKLYGAQCISFPTN